MKNINYQQKHKSLFLNPDNGFLDNEEGSVKLSSNLRYIYNSSYIWEHSKYTTVSFESILNFPENRQVKHNIHEYPLWNL